MAKTHFNTSNGIACGRPAKFKSDQVNRVTCLNCKNQPEYIDAAAEATARETEAFLAQEPRVFTEPWKEGTITCSTCLGTLFRQGNRTCYGHYDNFVCANCGGVESRLTETGMSF